MSTHTVRRAFSLLMVAVAFACKQSAAPASPTSLVFASLSTGRAHSCGIAQAGKAYCWGAGGDGQLGNGSTISSSRPVQVGGDHVFVTVSAGGYHTCALTSAGEAWCWGINTAGNLGNGGGPFAVATPVAVSGGLSFATISAGLFHTCAVSTTGAAYCWGGRNFYGELGDGSTNEERLVPTRVGGGLVFTAVSAGMSHTCARTVSGAVYCWGENAFGQLGVPVGGLGSATPVQVAGTLTFESVAAGRFHTCGRVSTAIYCWGDNFSGQLGRPGSGSTAPVQVSGALSFKAVDVGGSTSCAVTQTNSGYCWGSGLNGERGDGVDGEAALAQSTPALILGNLSFASVSPGEFYTCGLTLAGKAYCWGYNASGQLGDGTTANKNTPSPVTNP